MKLSVIIVSYNVKHYLQQCLDSLDKALEGINAEVYVVDNHSKDGSVDYLRKHNKRIKLIASKHNNGFATANNIAIRRSQSEYVLLLNPDTFVGENTIKECLDFMDGHKNAGGVGVRMLKCDGTDAMESRRGLPSPATALYKMCGLCTRFPHNRRFGKYYMGYLPWDKPAQIEVISGAFCLMRREALDKIGLLDEDFFMYGEDIDLSYRLVKGGYENWYLPYKILHYKGESTQKSSFRYVHVFYEAMLIFFRKHYGHLSFWIHIPIKLAIYAKATLALIKMMTENIKMKLGFVQKHISERCDYLFIGSGKALEECRQIAERNGLSAQYITGDESTCPAGHTAHTDKLKPEKTTYVVYDIASYKYETILENFSRTPLPHVLIGIFNPKRHLIITDNENID